ncbi:MAG: hypothetical protein FJW30_10575 [Acidobacteria bacterium]|nr:hypothetical protein [Acidobacteriota bacterium]
MIIVAIASSPFETAPLRGSRIHTFAEGPGPRLAARALENAVSRFPRIDVLLSIGLCGALDPALGLETIVSATRVNGHATVPLERTAHRALLSVDRFLGNIEEKARYFADGFGMVEMEAEPLARWAAQAGTRFHAVKVVSDLAGEAFRLDFNRYRDAEGRFRVGSIALHGLRYPADLYRMASRARPASAKLGEFLLNYEF